VPLPGFLIVGAMKAGTTTLYRDLLTNPEIHFPYHKEPHSLRDDAVLTEEGRREYARWFKDARPGQLCGEASTGYTKRPNIEGVVPRARQVLGPDLRVIYLVREPVSRIISHHYHEYILGQTTLGIDEAVRTDPRFLDYTRYAWQITPWIETFGRDQVLIRRFEDFVADRRGVVEEATKFLGLTPRPELVQIGETYNQSQGRPVSTGRVRRLRSAWIYRGLIRPMLPIGLRDRIRRALLPKAPPPPPPPGEATRVWILEQLAEDLERLGALLSASGPVWPEPPKDEAVRTDLQPGAGAAAG